MLKGILSISGQPGLFRMVAEAKNRIIVESLLNGKRMPVSSTARVSSLEDIAVYTSGGDLPLKEILRKISAREAGGAAIHPKAGDQEIRRYFEEVIPDYDRERVYISDIRKIIIWYNLLQEKGLLDFSEEEEEGTGDGTGAGDSDIPEAKMDIEEEKEASEE
jgi:hypothetical protein